MLRKLHRWVTLSPADKTAVAEAWVLLLLARIALARLDLARCERLLARLPTTLRGGPASRDASRLGRWVGVAAAHQPGQARCLARALVLHAMLKRRGQAAELRIGVRRLDRELEAHAWVECGGRPVDDGGETLGYSALLPAAGGG